MRHRGQCILLFDLVQFASSKAAEFDFAGSRVWCRTQNLKMLLFSLLFLCIIRRIQPLLTDLTFSGLAKLVVLEPASSAGQETSIIVTRPTLESGIEYSDCLGIQTAYPFIEET